MEQVPQVIQDFEDKIINPKFIMGGFPTRIIEDNEWITINTVLPELKELETEKQTVEIEYEVTMRRFKNLPTQIETLQLDALYLNTPIQEYKKQRPYYPRIILAVDTQYGILSKYHMYNSKEEDPENALTILQQLCETNKPKSLELREDSIEWIVEGFCKKVGIELVIKNELPFVDDVMEQI